MRLSRPDYFLLTALHQMLTSTFILAFELRHFPRFFNFWNPGEDGENIRPRITLKDVPEDFYDADSEEENVTTAKKGRPKNSNQLKDFLLCYAA